MFRYLDLNFDLNLLVRHYVWEFILNHIHGYLLYLFKYKNVNLLQNILLNLILTKNSNNDTLVESYIVIVNGNKISLW